ncbi:hypothetical protein N7532_011668 [Penicillium argentinense]|uniref:Thioesterase domain-containing protein n=1 Tax=Penicillium argentinense TaxID=1131581 RepID=A0A9W9EJ13_9EURO|nr:uncharacterized protein N7532_011668 [Penicillium argentinense]KAJ5082625.1 hypothetical protein N7532_011668 [Penicillium argentinense]
MDIDDAAHFQSIPWISELLKDESFITVPYGARDPKTSSEDSLTAVTLKSNSTLPACLRQVRRPAPQITLKPAASALATQNIEEVRIFFILGSDMNGHPGILHGGMVATLLDECLGFLVNARSPDGVSGSFTAYLNTGFVRPVYTPGAIVVYGQLEECIEDRKWKLKGRICDAEERILSTGETLFVKPRSKI